jgi:flagellar hook-associated protein 3 FlgL
MYQQGVQTMLNKQAELAKTQQQVATGDRILAPSDDPAAATRILELNQAIANNNQFQRNADVADARLGVEEAVLTSFTDQLQRVRELAVQGNNDTLTPEDRDSIATEVREILDSLLQIANTKDSNGEYIFAGYQTGTEPFSHDGMGNFTYAGDQGQRMLQIGSSAQVAIGDSGSDVFMRVDDGAGGKISVFDAVYEFIVDLEADAPSSTTLDRMDSAMDSVFVIRSTIGARMNTIENQRSMNDSFNLLLIENRSALADLDFAEAIARMEQQMLALEASQQTFAKIGNLSLFNYIR